jgi:hypothetical protein
MGTIYYYTGLLKAINSKGDIYGNRYWAFIFMDFKTGKQVAGTISGGDSNIYAILRYWNVTNDWDRSILFEREELPIREFNKLTKDYEYAGCEPECIAAYIKRELAK